MSGHDHRTPTVSVDDSRSPSSGHRPAGGGLRGLPAWPLALGGVVFAGAYGALLSYSMSWHDPDTWVALLVVPVLVVATLPVLLRTARERDDPTLAIILVAGLLATFAAAVVRWYIGAEVYGRMDAFRYLRDGQEVAEQLRAGTFTLESLGGESIIGTRFMILVTGIVLAIIGPSDFGTFMVFAWVGFLGMLAFLAAFTTAFPDGLVRRYAALVMFLPSLAYWPASVGKDAWMMLMLGLGAWGAARLLTRRRGGFVLLALGVAGASMVRPHIALLLIVATTVGFALRRPPPGRRPLFGPAGRVVGVAVLAAASVLVLAEVEDYFGIEGDQRGADGAEEVFDETERRTTTGGAEFEADRVRSPADVPAAAVTVLLRPFPWEAHNTQAMLTGFEGLLLIGLIGVGWRRMASIPRLVWRSPWAAVALSYTLMFIVAFSSFGNFGIIARQRVQVLPFFLALLCLPIVIKTARRRRAARSSPAEPEREVVLP